MIQCRQCQRFAPADLDVCPFCRSPAVEPFIPARDQKLEDEHRAYRIHISRLDIAGSHYRVIGPLARGGCSVILKVEAEDGGDVCALKVPFVFDELFTNRQGNGATALRKSERALWDEINTFDRVESPHTLHCHFKGSITASLDGKSATFPVILMELALASLEHLIHNHAGGHNPLPLAEKVKIIDHLLESVAYLHRHRLVHRDISPANVFVVRRAAGIRYIVSDYGSSRHGDDIDSSRFSSSILANYLYLDPQRLHDPTFAYDPRSDVYSVGIMMAEIFAGNFWYAIAGPPKRDGEPINFNREVLKPLLGDLLDPRLRSIVAKAVASRPSRRYPSIDALASSWQRYRRRLTAQNEPPVASNLKHTIEPLLLAILASILAVTLQTGIRFFNTAPPHVQSSVISSHSSTITRLVLAGDRDALETMLRQSGYTDTYGPNGWTSLHWAMYLKRYKIARLLMDHGADWNAPSGKPMFGIPSGTTPRQLFLDRHPRLEDLQRADKKK